ncbi:hypothetical protein OF377_01135 [Ureaplasma sp. ES3154-GEN]|uniref:hypothetical protein n=1 Tax=Ureaplasma sp. ES3154-GEN TaxID=2984844 RepID=UPI0021E78B5D|nr:hypothetical protein [Ureaplasma sp. ES3154-GEN]MCV3743491.1 hypothetical protein [Ureaplasma sp. ES3154-GEN]
MWKWPNATAFIKDLEQPRGGYLPHKMFKRCEKFTQIEPYKPNIDQILWGTLVDYLMRINLEKDLDQNKLKDILKVSIYGINNAIKRDKFDDFISEKTFFENLFGMFNYKNINCKKNYDIISLLCRYDQNYRQNQTDYIYELLKHEQKIWENLKSQYGLDQNEQKARSKLRNFLFDDVCKVKDTDLVLSYTDYKNLYAMVQNTLAMFDHLLKTSISKQQYSGLTFDGAPCCYIYGADLDYIIGDHLVEMKTTKQEKVNKNWSYQLLIYYLLGRRCSNQAIFEKIRYFTIINPKMNILMSLDITTLDEEFFKKHDAQIGFQEIYK